MTSSQIGPSLADGSFYSKPPATSAFSNAGALLSIFGAANSAIGTFFAMQSERIAGASRESSFRHQQSMSAVNARIAEDRAIGIQEAGQREVGRYTLQAGAEKSRRRASQAASGIQVGAGSAAEVQASGDILAKIDRYSIEANIARAAASARTQAVNIRNQGALAGVAAGNTRATYKSINPYVGLGTSLLSSAGTLAQEWRYAQRRR